MTEDTVTCIPPKLETGKSCSQIHRDFKPVKDLQLSDLPPGWRCQEALDVIGHVSQRVVMIYIPHMSSERPTSIFSNCPHFGGTGFAYYVDRYIVKVRTNLHVIYNAEEASMAIVQFSLHIPGKRHVRKIRLRATGYHFYNNLREDYASFTCFTTKRLCKFLHMFRDVPVLWDSSFFVNDSEDSDEADTVGTAKGDESREGDTCPLSRVCVSDIKQSCAVNANCGVKLRWRQNDGESPGRKCIQTRSDMWGTMLEGDVRGASRVLDQGTDEVETTGGHLDCDEMDYVDDDENTFAGDSRRCRRPTLEKGDYIAILSHPQGSEKCFSIGPAALYDPETLDKQRNNFRNLLKMSQIRGKMQVDDSAMHLINDRFKICKNRIYHTQSTFGCSGSPVLLFKHSLWRIRIPVVDYSQHSGTCFFRNGEKLGFATCFTPSVFCQIGRARHELEQCYSVIRKQERIDRDLDKLQGRKFEALDYTAESTHIVNTDTAQGNWGYYYKVDKGTVIRRRVMSEVNTSALVIPPVTSPLRSMISTGLLLPPTKSGSRFSETVADSREEKHSGTNKNGYMRHAKNNSDLQSSMWTDRLSRANSDVSTTRTRFIDSGNIGDCDGGNDGETASFLHSSKSKEQRCGNSCTSSHVMDETRYTLEGGLGYTVHRKNSRKIVRPPVPYKTEQTLGWEEHKCKREQSLHHQRYITTKNQTFSPVTRLELPISPRPRFTIEKTNQKELLTQDSLSNERVSITTSVRRNRFGSTSSCEASEDTSEEIPNWSSVVCFEKASKGKDVCSREIGDNVNTDKRVENKQRILCLQSPDSKSTLAVSKFAKDMARADLTDLDYLHQQYLCRAFDSAYGDHIHEPACAECSECSCKSVLARKSFSPTACSTGSSDSDESIDTNPAMQDQTAVQISDQPEECSEEIRKEASVSSCSSSLTPDSENKPLLFSGDKADKNIKPDDTLKENDSSLPVSKVVTEYKRDLISASLSDRDTPNETLSVFTEGSDEKHEVWNQCLESEILPCNDFMSKSSQAELAPPLSIFGLPESVKSNRSAARDKVERAEVCLSETNQDSHENHMQHKTIFDNKPFTHSSEQNLNPDDKISQLPMQNIKPCHADDEKACQDQHQGLVIEEWEGEKQNGMLSKQTLELEFTLPQPSPEITDAVVSPRSVSHTVGELKTLQLEDAVHASKSFPGSQRANSGDVLEMNRSLISQAPDSRGNRKQAANTFLPEEGTESERLPSVNFVQQTLHLETDSPAVDTVVVEGEDLLLKPISGKDFKPRPDHTNQPLSPSDTDIGNTAHGPRVSMQCHSENKTNQQLLHGWEDSITRQYCQSGQEEGKYVAQALTAPLFKLFPVERNGFKSRLATRITLDEGSFQDGSQTEQHSDTDFESSGTLLDRNMEKQVPEEHSLFPPSDCITPENDKENSSCSRWHLPLPRSVYTLRQLKVFEYERKRLCGEMAQETPQPGSGQYMGGSVCDNQPALGLQEMADRFLKMESPKIDRSKGQISRHRQLHNIENYWTEIEKQLIPTTNRTPKLFLTQPSTSNLRSAPFPSYGYAKPAQMYDLRSDYIQEVNGKGNNLPAYASVQTAGLPFDCSYNSHTSLMCRKSPMSHYQNDEAYRAFSSNKEPIDPAVSQGISYYTQVHRNIDYPSFREVGRPPLISSTQSNLSAADPKQSADNNMHDRLSRTGNNHNNIYAQGSSLFTSTDFVTQKLPAGIETNSQNMKNKSLWNKSTGKSGLDFDARIFQRGGSGSLPKVIPVEPPFLFPRRSSFWPGHSQILATKKHSFTQKSPYARNPDNSHSSDLPCLAAKSLLSGAVGSGPRHKNMELLHRRNMKTSMLVEDRRDMHDWNDEHYASVGVNQKPAHQNGLPGTLDWRHRYQSNLYSDWTDLPTDPLPNTQHYHSDKTKSCSSANTRHLYPQMGRQGPHFFPKMQTLQERSGAAYSHFAHTSNNSAPEPFTMDSTRSRFLTSECVHYQRESAAFNSSLGSSPVVPSSTDNSSFHSSPEISVCETETVPELSEQNPTDVKGSELQRPRDCSVRTAKLPLSVTQSSGAQYRPAEYSWNCAVAALGKLNMKADNESFSSLKTQSKTSITVPSLSKAFERFLSLDGNDGKVSCTPDAEGFLQGTEYLSHQAQMPAESFSACKSGEQEKSIKDKLGRGTREIHHIPKTNQSESMCFTDMTVDRTACHSISGITSDSSESSASLQDGSHSSMSDITSDSSESSASLEDGSRSTSALSYAFDRFCCLNANDGIEISGSKIRHSPRIKIQRNLAKSLLPGKSTEDCDWHRESRVYDLTSVVRVVLEMGIICPKDDSDLGSPVLPDSPQFDTSEVYPQMHADSVHKYDPTETDGRHLDSDSINKNHTSSDSNKSDPSLRKICAPVSKNVKVCDNHHINKNYKKSHLQKQIQNPDRLLANIDQDCDFDSNEWNSFPAPRTRQTNRMCFEHMIASGPNRKSAGGSTRSSQQTSAETSPVMCRNSGPSSKKCEAEHTNCARTVHFCPGSRHRHGYLSERRPSTLNNLTSDHVSADTFRFPCHDWQDFDNGQPCCHRVPVPFGLPWHNNPPYSYCSPLHYMYSKGQQLIPGFYPPFPQTHQHPHICTQRRFAECNHADANQCTSAAFLHPDVHQNWVVADRQSSSQETSDCSLGEVDNSQPDHACNEQACVATVDALDMSVVATVQDLGIVQVLLSDRQEEMMGKDPPKPSAGPTPLRRERCSTGTALNQGMYTKNKKITKTSKRYLRKKGKDKSDEMCLLHKPTPARPHQSQEESESKEAATSDRSTSSVEHREQEVVRILRCSELANDSGSEKSDREVCYVTVPVDIRVRLEKAAKWISTQLFGCPHVHFLTPSDAHTFSIQQNLHLTLQIMTLNG